MTAVKIVGITKKYQNGNNDTTVLNHTSLDIEKGEFVAIVGASGRCADQ